MSLRIENYYTPFTVERRVYAGDNVAQTYTPVSGDFSGFIQPVSGNEMFQNRKDNEKVTHRLYTKVDSNILYRDKIIQDGNSYFAVFAGQPKGISSVDHHKEILLMAEF